jgi:peptide/nickel transport system permease protein
MHLIQKYIALKKYKSTPVLFVFLIVIIGLFSSLIANDKPILLIKNQKLSFPVYSNKIYEKDKASFEIWPPIPYHSQSIDFNNMNSIGPFGNQDIESMYYTHWLGTDNLGRDLFAGLIHGSKTAVWVGSGSMLLALIIGLFFGGISGYFNNDKIRVRRSAFIAITIGIALFFTLSYSIIPWDIQKVSSIVKLLIIVGIFGGATVIGIVVFKTLNIIPYFKKQKSIPIDNYTLRLIGLLESIPLLFLIISLSALITPSYSSLILIIGISSWTNIAKFTRAEVLKIKEQNYVESSFALGMTNFQIIQKHILPNALPPIFISLAFGISSAILTEATLSFLGIGLGAENVSWGSILAGARSDYQAWWLVLFPGTLLFLTIYFLNQIGERLGK